ncbi:MAG: DUF5103 domain-containing protein [Bacteroidales bacterium]|jgi:hypothetical protein|nr:DUF5103 domain-containing protein [Bacteroidales bacterium]
MHGLLIFNFLFALIVNLFQNLPVEVQEYEPDSGYYTNSVLDNRIKTVQLYKEGWNLSYPVIKLNSDEKLILQFDLLDNQIESYDYTFIHCDKDWNRSDIFNNTYLEGFPDNQIEDVRPSFNTTVNYTHYKIIFPNDRIRFTLSGNYIVCVYPYGKPDKPVLIQQFVITENGAGINISTHRPRMTDADNARQQVDFTITLTGLNIIDPYRNIYSFILQNGRWGNAKKNLRPDLFGNNEVKYNSLSEKNIFNGGNEFRYFDIKSIRYQSEFIKRIDFLSPYYHVYLFPSENRESKPYFYWQDFNGKYYIASQEGRDSETDADYVNVYFTLHSKYKVAGGKMYVSGNLNNWAFDDNNLMIYNPLLEQYECTMLLKQGWYNYEYVFLADGDKEGTATKFEGSHYETENDYLVIVYYRNPRERYDRVIGSVTANTLNRISY